MSRVSIRRLLASRYLVALAALFVVGLGLGLVVARIAVGEPRVSRTEYAILTAQVYDKERNLPIATERLQSVGITEPSRSLAEMARRHPAGTTEQVREAQLLSDLARAFGATIDEAGPSASGSQPIWLLTVVVFAFVLLLGGALCYRVLGVRLPSRRDGVAPVEPIANEYAALPAGASALAAVKGIAGRVAALFGTLTARQSVRRPARAPQAARPVQVAPPARHGASGTAAAASPIVAAGRAPSTSDWGVDRRGALPPRGSARIAARGQFRFRSSYDLGDEPYDEIHPIADPRTMALVGACGVSAVHRLQPTRPADHDGGPDRYWGFTAWVQDYASDDQQLRSIGLVSRWAYLNCGAEIDVWLRSGQIDELRQVDVGDAVRLETPNISAVLTVEEYEHGSGTPADAYIARLATQFEVTLRPRQETGATSGTPSGLGSQGSAVRA